MPIYNHKQLTTLYKNIYYYTETITVIECLTIFPQLTI